ncbi:MAG TPA: hypothetical protein VFD71_03580 [Planctomycetota bacterium]|nr:hypothetical protein [Planctomycetota bacterium]
MGAQLDAAGRERVRAANLAQIRQWGIVAVEASGVYALARKAVSFGQEKAMPKACFLKTNWMNASARSLRFVPPWNYAAGSLACSLPAQWLCLNCMCRMGPAKVAAGMVSSLIIALGLAQRAKQQKGWGFAVFYGLLPWLLIPGILWAEDLLLLRAGTLRSLLGPP